ncbi:MAG: DUF3530 family protein [Oceanicoccus sp.]
MTKLIIAIFSLLWIPLLALAQDADQNTADESLFDLQVDEQEKAWINVGEQQELAFYLPASSGAALNGVLLIPDIANHPATFGSTNTMRIALSKNHWHTLALNMGYASEEHALDLIAAGIQFLNEKGVYNIAILGEGTGAAQAILYAAPKPSPDTEKDNKNEKNDQVRALIMINAKNSISNDETSILQNISQITIPVLDAFSNGNYIEQRKAEERKNIARGKNDTIYHQVRLPQASGTQQNSDNRVTKRIRGWLDKNVADSAINR